MMITMRGVGLAACACLCSLLAACATAPASLADYPPMPAGSAPGASPQALETARAMGRGVNLGNIFDAPTEGAWGLRYDSALVDRIAEAGFTNARLPVRWSNHASVDGEARIDPAFFKRVDTAVDALLDKGLVVVLNMHHYRQLDGDALDGGEAPVAAGLHALRFLNMWKQIAQHYGTRGPKLVFELYNEPHGAQNSRWNDLAARALQVVRASNPTRIVVIGPTQWNSANALSSLVLPNDPNLIVTVHHYEPFHFTHQGAEWSSGASAWLGTSCCDATQLAQMRGPLDTALAWSLRHRYPIYLGEFGAYGKADMAARATYTRRLRDEAERRGFSWAYWELASGFGVYDPAARAWREPLKNALLGP
jgi:endoglucanase